jgi:hypothetical protein
LNINQKALARITTEQMFGTDYKSAPSFCELGEAKSALAMVFFPEYTCWRRFAIGAG